MNLQLMEAEMARASIFMLAISIALTVLAIWITYLVIKNAVRDGISESGLVEALRYRPPAKQSAPGTTMPEMKAD